MLFLFIFQVMTPYEIVRSDTCYLTVGCNSIEHFLILYAIGKTDKQVQTIMAITQEAIRSTRFRIRENNKKRG